MCVSPLMIERRYAGKSKIDMVPCGRCYECISKKQNEFAALACLEAKRSSSMWFFKRNCMQPNGQPRSPGHRYCNLNH